VTYDDTPKPDWELTRDELAERYRYVHLWAIRKFVKKDIQREYDWESEFLLLVVKCMNRYDRTRKIKFMTFYYVSARWAVDQYLESGQRRFANTMTNLVTTYDKRDLYAQLVSRPSHHEEEIATREEFEQALNLFTTTERECVLCELGFTEGPIKFKVGPNRGQNLTSSQIAKRFSDAIIEAQRRLGLRPERIQRTYQEKKEAKRRAAVAARRAERQKAKAK